MTLNYEHAKTSFFIEEQLPNFVQMNGSKFIDFLKLYYDWLEKRMILITLKSESAISEEDIQINEILGSSQYYLSTEDEEILVSEDQELVTVMENNYSLSFNGVSGYTDYDGTVIDTSNDFSVTLFIKTAELPSIERTDYDLITLSNTTYFSLLKIFEASNELGYNINNEDISTGIVIRKNEWYMISIRYNSTLKKLTYDIFSTSNIYKFTFSEDLSSLTNDRFVLGCDLYNSRNFSYSKIDEVSIFERELSNTEITEIYNDGTAIDVTSYSNLSHYYRFEDTNNIVIIDEVSSNNCTIYNDVSYTFETPFNLAGFITEIEEDYNLLFNVISFLNLSGGEEGVMSNRMLLFGEHIYGKVEKDIIIKARENAPILISEFIEAKNPLNVINNLNNFQEIDYVFNFNNFVSNIYFKYLWKEIMFGFPLFLHSSYEETIKDIIAKNIKDFYKSKGTFKSIKLFFKLLYNEDLEIGTDIYTINSMNLLKQSADLTISDPWLMLNTNSVSGVDDYFDLSINSTIPSLPGFFYQSIDATNFLTYMASVKIKKDSVPKETRFCGLSIGYPIIGAVIFLDTSTGEYEFQNYDYLKTSNGGGVIDGGDHWLIYVFKQNTNYTKVQFQFEPASGYHDGNDWIIQVPASTMITEGRDAVTSIKEPQITSGFDLLSYVETQEEAIPKYLPHEYYIKTRKFTSVDALSYIKKTIHPVGYKLNLLPPD